MMKCEKVLSLDHLCSWHQTLDAAHDNNGLGGGFGEAGFLANSEHVAACRAAEKARLKIFFVDCDLFSNMGQNMQWALGRESRRTENALLWSTSAKIISSDIERVGVCPEAVSELQDWVSTHSSVHSRVQLSNFMFYAASPSPFKHCHLREHLKSSRRLCGIAKFGGPSDTDIANYQTYVVDRRDQHMHSNLVGLAHSLSPPNTAWRLCKEPSVKVLFICGRGHVAGIQKLFDENQ